MNIARQMAADAAIGGSSVSAEVTSGASVTAELGRDISVDVNITDGAQVTVELTAGPELDVDLGAGGAVDVEVGGSAELYLLPDGELDGYYTKSEADEKLAGKADADHDHDGRYYTEAEAAALLALKSDEGHIHDERYYTEAETDTLLAGKSGTNHNHDSRYYTETETDALLAGKSNTGHTHDDRYYTETEIDAKLAGKSLTSLWGNPSPGSNFAAQSIGVDLSDYDYFAVALRFSTGTNDNPPLQVFAVDEVRKELPIQGTQSNKNGGRHVTYSIANKTLTFDAAYYDGQSNNSYAIPIAVYGVANQISTSGGDGGGGGLPSGGSVGDVLMKVAPGDDGAGWVTPASSAEEDNTRPITAAAVYTEIGNINALLATV